MPHKFVAYLPLTSPEAEEAVEPFRDCVDGWPGFEILKHNGTLSTAGH
jgi:hypothetical protein